MSEKIKYEMISRRMALSLLGLGALSLAVPGTLLGMSDAEAQQAVPTSPPAAPSAPQTGTERRQARRTSRVSRRAARRKGRKDRRDLRRTGGEEKK